MLRTCIVVIVFLAASMPAKTAAAQEEYEVEVIVFERAALAVADDELWNFSSPRDAARMQRIRKLARAAKKTKHEILPDVYRLKSAREKLLGARHRILATLSWRQKASLRQHAPLIALGGAPGRAQLTGFARIYTTSLIYADIDLQLLPPAFHSFAPAAPEMRVAPRADAPHYFISEKRRLKFNQLHYFDHPLFGVILGVWPALPEDEFAL